MYTIGICIALMSKFAAPDAIPATSLCPAIFASAKEHGLDPYILTKVVLHESKGREAAYNWRTQDIGIMQVHLTTARHYGFTEGCIHIWQCNLDVGSYILADILSHKHTRLCSYNVGSHYKTKMQSCLRYETALATIKTDEAINEITGE
jgi:soluble lytic murein transglycosylase-like protein